MKKSQIVLSAILLIGLIISITSDVVESGETSHMANWAIFMVALAFMIGLSVLKAIREFEKILEDTRKTVILKIERK